MNALAVVIPDICPDCGREWPLNLGHHNCNYRRLHVHKNAVVVEPGAGLPESIRRLTERLYRETCSSAEYADLGGNDSPYPAVLADIDAALGHLKRFRAEVQGLSKHAHDWTSGEYCAMCGADGRA